ncbi:hypothetical protein F4821DRAFT_223364 [Hypoxylon rubiginosum]|uniref:Uncharacterized protein n=1 Tax=Hypoxylon rubiginosum TaxID=110542 RepID=A0ACC0DIZ5_9PEZI|nr:hypothetical protein F4821DRAFT_223364 [Hypoxylon rubiginosum]
MAREKKKAPAPTRGVRAVTRRAKLDRAAQQDNAWRALNPLKAAPKLKHRTYFELVENADKKKKQLEFKITTDRHPPPGFEFVPIGHPKLTQACKDLSREQDAMIFIVSNSTNPENLDHHMNRVGYHFRGTIVDQAREVVEEDGQSAHILVAHHLDVPEPIPETQEEINRQADAVLKDLFPRIPNIDRMEIIQHAFQKDGKFHDKDKVGMASDLTLARRVQLAAIAHIRHTLTRYDELLKTTSWTNARKAVEKPCLAIIVKWRGDEETGRDQLDEILREVIEISDTEEDSEGDTPNGNSASAQPASIMPPTALATEPTVLQDMRTANPPPSQAHRRDLSIPGALASSRPKGVSKAEKRSARKTKRFRRYAAAAEALAGSSHQNGRANDSNAAHTGSVTMDLTMSPGPARSVHPSREPTVVVTRGTPIIEQVSRHVELRTDSQYFNGDRRSERIATVANGYAPPPPQSIHDPEGHRPKVGHPQTSYGYEQVPVSPVRHGLQDMLLQSIEPASPAGAQASRGASRVSHREPWHFEEPTRITARGVYEPMGSAPYHQPPRDVIHGDEFGARRYRVADRTAGEPDAYPGSFISINRQGQGEDPGREPVRYFSDRPVSSFGGADQHQAWPVTSDRMAHYHDDTPVRSRANPVIVDDAFRRPHQVVEVQRRPNEDYQVAPLRRDEMMRDVPIRRDTHVQNVQDSPRIVYIREAHPRPRSSYEHYSVPVNHPGHGLTTYEETNSHRIPAAGHRQHVVVDAPLDHEHRDYRQPSHNQHFGREPVVWPGNESRNVRVVDSDFRAPEIRYASARHDFPEGSNPVPVPEHLHDRRHAYRHELVEPVEVEPQQTHYRREHQSYATPSVRDEYIESREPSLRRYVPEPQRVIWVDR